jgi:hypothetical protein
LKYIWKDKCNRRLYKFENFYKDPLDFELWKDWSIKVSESSGFVQLFIENDGYSELSFLSNNLKNKKIVDKFTKPIINSMEKWIDNKF